MPFPLTSVVAPAAGAAAALAATLRHHQQQQQQHTTNAVMVEDEAQWLRHYLRDILVPDPRSVDREQQEQQQLRQQLRQQQQLRQHLRRRAEWQAQQEQPAQQQAQQLQQLRRSPSSPSPPPRTTTTTTTATTATKKRHYHQFDRSEEHQTRINPDQNQPTKPPPPPPHSIIEPPLGAAAAAAGTGGGDDELYSGVVNTTRRFPPPRRRKKREPVQHKKYPPAGSEILAPQRQAQLRLRMLQQEQDLWLLRRCRPAAPPSETSTVDTARIRTLWAAAIADATATVAAITGGAATPGMAAAAAATTNDEEEALEDDHNEEEKEADKEGTRVPPPTPLPPLQHHDDDGCIDPHPSSTTMMTTTMVEWHSIQTIAEEILYHHNNDDDEEDPKHEVPEVEEERDEDVNTAELVASSIDVLEKTRFNRFATKSPSTRRRNGSTTYIAPDDGAPPPDVSNDPRFVVRSLERRAEDNSNHNQAGPEPPQPQFATPPSSLPSTESSPPPKPNTVLSGAAAGTAAGTGREDDERDSSIDDVPNHNHTNTDRSVHSKRNRDHGGSSSGDHTRSTKRRSLGTEEPDSREETGRTRSWCGEEQRTAQGGRVVVASSVPSSSTGRQRGTKRTAAEQTREDSKMEEEGGCQEHTQHITTIAKTPPRSVENRPDHHDRFGEDWTTSCWCWAAPLHNTNRGLRGVPITAAAAVTSTRSVKRPKRTESSRRSRSILPSTNQTNIDDGNDGTDLDQDSDNVDGDDGGDDDDDQSKSENGNCGNGIVVTSERAAKSGKKIRYEKKWNKMYGQLVQYKKTFKTITIDKKFHDKHNLKQWVWSQRQQYSKKTICVDRINRLESIGFIWNALDAQWMEKYERLVKYKKQNKTTCVPDRYRADPQLARWVRHQRSYYHTNRSSLTLDRITQLDAIGFVWKTPDFDAKWTEKYYRLVRYKKQNKTTCVPDRYPEDPQLARWVRHQRSYYKTNQPFLTADRITQLNSIGFVWNILDAQWTEKYDRLVKYKKKYKSTCVPDQYPADPQLARWVHKQRTQNNFNKSCLTADRITQLDSIGFVWNPRGL